MFKFNFSNSDDNKQEDEEKETRNEWFEAQQIIPEICKYNNIKNLSVQQFSCKDSTLKYISCSDILNELKETADTCNCILNAEESHSDLVTAKYEGGLKIWECTSDLLNYFSEQTISLSDKKVLDLGCGAGLLGLYALTRGSLVDFQDYNKEVIEFSTIPNVIINQSEQNTLIDRCKFYAGDWSSFMKLARGKYDYIFTSETIYNHGNYKKLLSLFVELIKDDGTIYVAAKTYYFGVGGSIRQFEEDVKKQGVLQSSVCWKQQEGVQREILKIFKK